MRKNIVKSICFTLIAVLLFGNFIKIFRFKYGDGIYPLDIFYEQEENSIDVMFFGSSHIFENVNTGVLWDEHGIAAFNLCGSIQPLWNTYYYIKEALKTQSPKLIVVDVYRALEELEYIDESRIIKNNYGLKLSSDKIESIKVSSPKETQIDYMLEYPTYHSRYGELNRSDFLDYLGKKDWEYWKGFGINTRTVSLTQPEGIDTTEVEKLTPKTERYLQKIIELTKKEDIPLLLVTTPYLTNVNHQKKYNHVWQIALKNDIPYVDFNMLYQEICLNFETDFADSDHLNHRGNVKFTSYLGDYIKEHYQIPDHRKDSGYKSYVIMAENVRQRIYNQQLRETPDIGTFIDLTQNENYLCIFTVVGNYKEAQNYEAVRAKLSEIGIHFDDVDSDYAWIQDNNKIIFTSNNNPDFLWHEALENGDNIMIKQNKNLQINYNNSHFSIVTNGLNLMIYDRVTGELVESAGFECIGGQIQYTKKLAS